eukprot:3337115-Rhodomonas_salina.1
MEDPLTSARRGDVSGVEPALGFLRNLSRPTWEGFANANRSQEHTRRGKMGVSGTQVAWLAGRVDRVWNVGADDGHAHRNDLADAASASQCLRNHWPWCQWWLRHGRRRVLLQRECVRRWGVCRLRRGRRWRGWLQHCQGWLNSWRQVELLLSWPSPGWLIQSGTAGRRGRG